MYSNSSITNFTTNNGSITFANNSAKSIKAIKSISIIKIQIINLLECVKLTVLKYILN